MDIRFTNRWAGFTTGELCIILDAIKWCAIDNDTDFDDLIEEIDQELRRRNGDKIQ